MQTAGIKAIRSMTGYGNSESFAEGWQVTIDIRSVNGRFFDCNIRCPDEIRSLEPWLRDQLAASIQRGKVELRIHLKRQATATEGLRLNRELMNQVFILIGEIKRRSPDAGSFSPLELLRFPGIGLEPEALEQERIFDVIKSIMPLAISRLEDSRKGEGAKLALFIKERVALIRAHCESLHKQLPAWSTALEQRLRERLAGLGYLPSPADQKATPRAGFHEHKAISEHSLELLQRIALELGVYAVKADVAEELSRLSAHADAVDEIITQGGTCGKRLDFMMQELQREANTLGAKSQIIEQSLASVDLKVLIEQMREQVQNLE